VMGDHDLLVQGLVAPDPLTDTIARGDRAVWDLPGGLSAAVITTTGGQSALAPDGLPAGAPMRALIEELLSAPSVRVPPDARRRELSSAELLASLRTAGTARGRESPSSGRPERDPGAGEDGALLDYAFDVGGQVRVLVLDLARREGGSGGVVHAGQADWLERELASASGRWLLVFTHQPLASSSGGEELLELLDRQPRVLAAVCGHTHRNRITSRGTGAGGYWLIETASLIDYPQQARALRVRATATGAAIETWMLDHVPDGIAGLGDISRQLAYLDAQGGRPLGFAGAPLDRNVRLYCRDRV